MEWWDQMPWSQMLSFKPSSLLSSFTFIKRLFISSLLSAIRVVSSAFPRLLIFLTAILIQACASSSPAFLMMYSACELNKQGDNIKKTLTYSFPDLEPVCCSMSSSNCCFLTCIQISQEAGQVVWYSHIFKNFPQFVVIHTVRGFGIDRKQKFFWNSLAFSMIQQMLAIWTLVPMPFLNPAGTSANSQLMYCWSLVWRIWGITLLLCEMSAIVW